MADAFFDGHPQQDVAIRQYRGKVPMFFRRVRMMSAVFTADLGALERALPPQLERKPIQVWPGQGLAAIGCFEYEDTDIGPYNEVALSIPFFNGKGIPSPREVIASLRGKEVSAYIKELPVTTEAALFGGVDFFNYPKYLADITFSETETTRTCALRESAGGALILELAGKKLATRAAESLDVAAANTYPILQGRPVLARLLMNRQQSASTLDAAAAQVRLGPSARAEPFRELGLGRLLQYVYAPRCQTILLAPQAL